jgi:predicted RNA-binding Zn-ribbon protein involved in translation (DUF1610 family)
MEKCLRATHIVARQSVSGQSSLKLTLNNPCPNCGNTSPPRTGAGRKPQEASLHCASCKRFLRWVSANEKAVARNTLS